MNEDSIKEKIIQATINLMKEDSEDITVRNIAARAGVTQGLINYHYQTKDHLIDISAQRVIDETVSKVPMAWMQMEGTPEEKLRVMMKRTLSYLFEYPHVSRISIMRDMQAGHNKDNTQSSIDAFDKLLQHTIADKGKRFLAGHVFCAAMQSLFLRSDVIMETQGMDVADSAVQRQFIDDLVDLVLGGFLSCKIK